MVPPTRRALLQGAAGLTATLAGCSSLTDDSTEPTPTASEDTITDGPASGSATDPDVLLVRTNTDRPPMWLGDPESEGDGRPTPSERDRWRDSVIVDDSARADRISVADTVDSDRVESFLAETDFESETVYVEMGQVGECFRLELCQISWTPTEISTDYARRTRPYTERCDVDESVFEARLIRIPDAIEEDDVNTYSSSIGTGACGRRQARAEGESGSVSSSSGESTTRTGTTTDSGGDQ
jgi:hypothetical protein